MKPFIVFILFILSFSSSSNAKTKNESLSIHLVGFNVPRFVIDENRGEFIQLLKKIASKTGIDLKISITPPQRALLLVKQGRVDGYFPGLNELKRYLPELKTLDTNPFYFKKDFLFSQIETSESLKESHLKGKKICLTTGYPYDHKFVEKHKFQIESSSSDYGCLRMLAAKRVDYFMGELMSGVSALNEISDNDRKLVKLIPNSISSLPVFFSFKESEKSRKVVSLFNRELEKMRASSELSQVFNEVKREVGEKYNFTYDPSVP